MSLGAPQILLIVLLLILLFGKGRISSLMGEMAKGIQSFRKGMNKTDVIDVETQKNDDEIKH